MALGLALIVSVFVAASGPSGDGLAAGGVDVSQLEGRFMATALDSTLPVVSPESEPFTAIFPTSPPAPPLDVERAKAEPTPVLFFGAFPTSPPASEIDATPTPEPLAAALPALPGLTAPLLAQTPTAQEPAPSPTPPSGAGQIQGVNITFYDCLEQGFCGAMYNGEPVYEGAAACSWDLPLGTRFVIENDPTQRVYVCADRGLLANTWVDIFFYSPADGWAWQQEVGRYATIHILSALPFEPAS